MDELEVVVLDIDGTLLSNDAHAQAFVDVGIRSDFQTVRRLIVLGDTPYDVEAAKRAAIEIVALRSGGWTDKDLKGALAVYDHPADLLAHYDESIFERSGAQFRKEPR